jgi:hypothetical protein
LVTAWSMDVKRTTKSRGAGYGKTKALFKKFSLGWYLLGIPITTGVISTVGGTVMQLAGVYRNCVCTAGLKYAINYTHGVVDLATDTLEDRESWIFWWRAGLSALVFFTVTLLLASFNEMWMKETCEEIIEFLVVETKRENARREALELRVLSAVPESDDNEEGSRDSDNDLDVDMSDHLSLLHRYETLSAKKMFRTTW